MRKIVLLLCAIIVFGYNNAQTPFTTLWNVTSTSGNTISFDGVANLSGKWTNTVSGATGTVNVTTSGITTITLPTAGTYRLEILPVAPTTTIRLKITNGKIFNADVLANNTQLVAVEKWGTTPWAADMSATFDRCKNMDVTATDIPNLSQVTNMKDLFWACENLVGTSDFNRWNTSNVTNMNGVFVGASKFNQPIGGWNTVNVTTMANMFNGAEVFNQPIGGWVTSKVTSFSQMFNVATAFNQPIGSWDTHNVTEMDGVFSAALNFNKPLNNWDLSNVTTTWGMFLNASSYNQPMDLWKTGNVTNMNSMFQGASKFNQNIGMWDLHSVLPAAANETGYKSMITAFNNVNWDCANFTKTLQGWANSPTTPNGIKMDAIWQLVPPEANAPIAALRAKGWTINTSGPTTSCLALPVKFGAISAIIKNGQLLVNWVSETETNNNHFLVQASKDGENFTTIGTVKSQALNGNSSAAINYSFETGASNVLALAGISLLGIGLLAFSRKNRFILMMAIICGLGFITAASCGKSQDTIDTNVNSKLFVRIIQVDKDGTKSSSKIVTVVSQ